MTDNADQRGADGDADLRAADYPVADHPVVSRPMESTRMVRSEASALADLQLHWGSAYEIGLDGNIWSATFRGTSDELRAHSPGELRVLIRADYAYRRRAGPAWRLVGPAEPDDRGEDQPGESPRRAGDTGGAAGIRGERMSL